MRVLKFIPKKLIILLYTLLLAYSSNSYSGSIISINNGDWNSNTTWITLGTGTITSSINSTTVSGINTNFTTELSVGDVIRNSNYQVIGTISSISSNTALSLVANAAGDISNSIYFIGRIPTLNDDVFVNDSHFITIYNNTSCSSLTITSANDASNGVTISGTSSLTVSNSIKIYTSLTSFKVGQLNLNNGTVICGSLSLFADAISGDSRTEVNIINGLLEINGNTTGQDYYKNKITISGSGVIKFGGQVNSNLTFNLGAGSSTVYYNGNVPQTCYPSNYYNLVLGGTGVKTVTGCTVNNILRIDSTASLSGPISYGTAAGLIYNTTQNRTVSSYEWPTPFTGTSGVTITNTGTITLNEDKILGIDADLTILTNGKLNTSSNNYGLIFYADFLNDGTLQANASNITITNTAAIQSIGTFSTTGTVSLTKTSGEATFSGNISGGMLMLNGSGGTLSCGNGYTHTFTKLNYGIGTLKGGTSTINFTDSAITGFGVFIPETSTVKWISNESAQDIASFTYYNLEFGGSSVKTTYALNNINNNFVMSGTASTTTTSNLGIGGNFSIGNGNTYNAAGYQILIQGTTTIGGGTGGTLNFSSVTGLKEFKGDFTINNGATITNSINSSYKIGGNFTNNGNYNSGTGTITFSGTNKIISGTSTFSNLAISGTYTLNANLIISSTLTGTGSLTIGSSGTLNINTATTPTITSLVTSTTGNTVIYGYAGAQTILSQNYYNLTLSNSGIKTLQIGTSTINGNLLLEGSARTTLVKNLDLNGNLTLTGTPLFTSNVYKLNIAGNINCINRDQFDFAGTLEMDGNSQSFTSNGTTSIPISNLILTGGEKIFNSTMYINSLTINSGSSYKFGTDKAYEVEFKSISGTGTFVAKACGASNGNRIIVSGSTASIDIYMDPTFYHLATFTNVKTAGNVNLRTPIAIYFNLTLPSTIGVNTLFYDELNLYGNAFSISNLSSNLTAGGVNSSLKIGGCSNAGLLLTLPTGFFSSNTNTLKNLTIDRQNGVALSNQILKVTDTLKLLSGNFNTNGNLILASTSTKTARVAPLGATASISGNVTVQRFIPGGSNKRKWRLLSAPVNLAGSISLSQFIDNIFVTAPASTNGGFDASPNNNSSIRTYNESILGASNLGWVDPTDINNTVPTGTGMEVFVRGSRNLLNPYLNWTIPDDVTIDYTGSLNTGTITKTLTYTPTNGGTTADGFNLVGNPYASPINFDTTGWTKTNIENKFWCYNPNTSNYGIYDAGAHTGTNGITKYIASGQAFFVRATSNTAPKIIFTENVKCKQIGNKYFKSVNEDNMFPILRMSLINDSSDFDETIILIDSADGSSAATDVHDAAKFFNDELNIYSVTNDKSNLAINAINVPSTNDTINLSIWSYYAGSISTKHHQLGFSNYESIDSSIKIYLIDEYLHTSTNIRENNTYDFMITSDATTYGNNRFKMIFSQKTSSNFEEKKSTKCIVYPNPVEGKLFVQLFNSEAGVLDYTIFDLAGREITKGVRGFNRKIAELQMEELERGHYIVKIDINGYSSFHQIIKK